MTSQNKDATLPLPWAVFVPYFMIKHDQPAHNTRSGSGVLHCELFPALRHAVTTITLVERGQRRQLLNWVKASSNDKHRGYYLRRFQERVALLDPFAGCAPLTTRTTKHTPSQALMALHTLTALPSGLAILKRWDAGGAASRHPVSNAQLQSYPFQGESR